ASLMQAAPAPAPARGRPRRRRKRKRERDGTGARPGIGRRRNIQFQPKEWDMDDREVAGPRARKRWTAGAAVAICGLLASAPATAQWAVVDLPHTVKTALGWVAQYQQMIESYQRQVEQLQTLNKQYEQALVKGEAYAGTQGVRQNFQ